MQIGDNVQSLSKKVSAFLMLFSRCCNFLQYVRKFFCTQAFITLKILINETISKMPRHLLQFKNKLRAVSRKFLLNLECGFLHPFCISSGLTP